MPQVDTLMVKVRSDQGWRGNHVFPTTLVFLFRKFRLRWRNLPFALRPLW